MHAWHRVSQLFPPYRNLVPRFKLRTISHKKRGKLFLDTRLSPKLRLCHHDDSIWPGKSWQLGSEWPFLYCPLSEQVARNSLSQIQLWLPPLLPFPRVHASISLTAIHEILERLCSSNLATATYKLLTLSFLKFCMVHYKKLVNPWRFLGDEFTNRHWQITGRYNPWWYSFFRHGWAH